MPSFPIQTEAGPLDRQEAEILAGLKDSVAWTLLRRYFVAERGNVLSKIMEPKTGIDDVNHSRGRLYAIEYLVDFVEKTVPAAFAEAAQRQREEEAAKPE